MSTKKCIIESIMPVPGNWVANTVTEELGIVVPVAHVCTKVNESEGRLGRLGDKCSQ